MHVHDVGAELAHGVSHRRPVLAFGWPPAGPPVRLAAGPSAFPAKVLAGVAARTGCQVQIVPPLATGELPGPGIDMVELRGDEAGTVLTSGRLELIEEPAVAGLGDVLAGELLCAVRALRLARPVKSAYLRQKREKATPNEAP